MVVAVLVRGGRRRSRESGPGQSGVCRVLYVQCKGPSRTYPEQNHTPNCHVHEALRAWSIDTRLPWLGRSRRESALRIRRSAVWSIGVHVVVWFNIN